MGKGFIRCDNHLFNVNHVINVREDRDESITGVQLVDGDGEDGSAVRVTAEHHVALVFTTTDGCQHRLNGCSLDDISWEFV